MTQDNCRSVNFSYFKVVSPPKLKFLIFLLITYFRYQVTEYCTVIGAHSTVRGDKLLYGHVPDSFPLCGTGSGHTRLGPRLESIMLSIIWSME